MSSTLTHTTPPLEGTWVEHPLALVVEGAPVTGMARACWGAIEVTMFSPAAGLRRGADARGWAFAMACHHRPERRYALGGRLTERGRQAAECFLSEMYLDWLAVSRHSDDIDAACRDTRRRLDELERACDEQARRVARRRPELRRMFRTGEMTQREYQAARQALARDLDQVHAAGREARQQVQLSFRARTQGLCGRDVPLHEAELLLAQPTVIVVCREAGPGAGSQE